MLNTWYVSLPEYVSVERRKVKWARVEVKPNGTVRLIVPSRMGRFAINQLYRKKCGWIERKRAGFARQVNNSYFTTATDQLLVWGDRYGFNFDSNRKAVELDRDELQIHAPMYMQKEQEQIKWHMQFSKTYLTDRINNLATEKGFSYHKLYIRNQKTRWGSCSNKKNISLNWRLIKCPVYVSDYVILHELVHTRVLNHSAKFWQLVAHHDSDYLKAKGWLKKFGHQI